MPDKNKLYGALFWFLFIVLIGCLFAINYKKMNSVMEQTGFFDLFRKKTGTVAEKTTTETEKKPSGTNEQAPLGDGRVEPLADVKNIVSNQSDFTSVGNTKTDQDSDSAAKESNETSFTQTQVKPPAKTESTEMSQPRADSSETPVPQPAPVPPSAEQQPKNVPDKSQTAPVKPAAKKQTLALWFVVIDDDGTVLRKETKREVPASDSPLSVALAALLAGPDRAELEKGYMSLIPEETQLRSAVVRNGTATLNFNDAFQFNKFGVEGYFGQLMQIVYTATAFPTVTSVQILIEGEKKEYLGSEGVWIGTPLTRTNFR